MAKGKAGPSRGGRRGPPSKRGMPEPELSDSGDEGVIEDAFAAGKGKVSFGGDGDEDSIDEEAVYDLSDSGSGSEDEGEDEEDDKDLDLEEEIERGGKAGRREFACAAPPPPAAAAAPGMSHPPARAAAPLAP
jgi:hypothetical protein